MITVQPGSRASSNSAVTSSSSGPFRIPSWTPPAFRSSAIRPANGLGSLRFTTAVSPPLATVSPRRVRPRVGRPHRRLSLRRSFRGRWQRDVGPDPRRTRGGETSRCSAMKSSPQSNHSIRKRGGFAPAELRFCFDTLRPLVENYDEAEVDAFHETLCHHIKDVYGMGHYVLPIDRDSSYVRRHRTPVRRDNRTSGRRKRPGTTLASPGDELYDRVVRPLRLTNHERRTRSRHRRPKRRADLSTPRRTGRIDAIDPLDRCLYVDWHIPTVDPSPGFCRGV